MPVNSWIRFWIRSRNHMQPGNRYFPLRLGTRIFPAAGGICFSWGIPYSYYWFPRRFPRSSLGFGYIHRTHSNHRFLRVRTELVLKCTDQRQSIVVYIQLYSALHPNSQFIKTVYPVHDIANTSVSGYADFRCGADRRLLALT